MELAEPAEPAGSARRRGPARPPGPRAPGAGACVLLVAAIFAQILAFGGNGPELGLLFAALYALLAAWVLTRPWARAALARPGALAVPGALFLAVVALGLLSLVPLGLRSGDPAWSAVGAPATVSINHQATAIELLKLTGLGFVFLTGFVAARERSRAWLIVRAVVAASLPFALLSLWLHLFSPATLFGYAITTGPDRLASTLGSANVAGTLFGMLALSAAAAVFQQWKRATESSSLSARQVERFVRRAPLEVLALLLSSGCLVLTQSRSAIAAAAASLLVLVVWQGMGEGLRAKRWFVPVAVAFSLAAVIGVGGDMVADRYLQSGADLGARLSILQAHWRGFQGAMAFGSGLGSFADINRLLLTRANAPDLLLIGATHNVYLEWLEQTGLVGSLLMWSCIGSMIAAMGVALFSRRSLSVALRLALCASLLVLTHGMTDFSLEVPAVASLWTALLGLGLGRATSTR